MRVLQILVFVSILCFSMALKGQNNNLNSTDKDEIVEFADQTPEFPGGYPAMEQFIQKHLKYPDSALDKNIQGTVFLKFLVHSDGRISNIKIIKDIGYGCGLEGKRVLESMPPWTPGKMNGKPVTTPIQIPIKFVIRNNYANQADSIIANEHKKPVGEVYDYVEKAPLFPGGHTAMQDFLKERVQYPEAAKRARVKGKVLVSAIVDKDGNLTDFEILKDLGYGCGAEALRVCKMMPKWTPGQRDGQIVNSIVRIPVIFSP